MSMPGAFEGNEDPDLPSLPVYESDVRDVVEQTGNLCLQGEGDAQREDSSAPSRPHSIKASGLLGRCYGSVRKLINPRARRRAQDEEAAAANGTGPVSGSKVDPTNLSRKPSNGMRRNDTVAQAEEVESYHLAAETVHQSPPRNRLANPVIASDPSPRLLSDEENERMNRKIDKLMAAIDDRRLIHFAPDTNTGEVEIFAHRHDEVNEQDDHELERNVAALPEIFGRIIRSDNSVHRIRSPTSLNYAESTDSWASTNSKKSSSNAWERAIAAANVRYALEYGGLEQENTVIKQPSRSSEMGAEAPRGRRLVRTVSPIPLDYNKQSGASTPSIFSNGSELDTSSPLFGKFYERDAQEAYAESPGSTYGDESQEHSQLGEWADIPEPPDEPSPQAEVPVLKTFSSTRRAFGVFEDDAELRGAASKKTRKSAIRSKVLKDVSNLRRPGYLQFNSFSKDKNLASDQRDTAVPVTAPSMGFGGASNPGSRRAYIDTEWPGLLQDRSNLSTIEPPRIDGVARRRNEQAIGRPIDRSHYSLSHVRTSVADSPLNIDPIRQAHFDLALARLEGRALPLPPEPIRRHPDWAALYDRDVQIEGSHRPLPLRGPRPTRLPILITQRALRRYLEGREGRDR